MSASEPGPMRIERESLCAADVTAPATADSVPYLRGALTKAARALGVDQATCKRIALAVSEAGTNAVLHAFPDRPGTVRAQIFERDGTVDVIVSDDGIGLTPRHDSPGLGLGLGLIAEVADELQISSEPGRGTALHMTFRSATTS